MFAALPLPEPVLKRLEAAARELKSRHRELKVVRPEGMHLTLRFFGELEETAARSLGAALEAAPALRVGPIAASLAGYGRFPPHGSPRVIWCGLGEGEREVRRFQEAFEEVLAAAGFPPDPDGRAFTPHITLARAGNARLPAGVLEGLPPAAEAFRFDRLVLFQSILRREGAEYRPLATVPFGKGGA